MSWLNFKITIEKVNNGYILTMPKFIEDKLEYEDSVIEGEDADTLVRVLQEVRDYFDSNAKIKVEVADEN